MTTLSLLDNEHNIHSLSIYCHRFRLLLPHLPFYIYSSCLREFKISSCIKLIFHFVWKNKTVLSFVRMGCLIALITKINRGTLKLFSKATLCDYNILLIQFNLISQTTSIHTIVNRMTSPLIVNIIVKYTKVSSSWDDPLIFLTCELSIRWKSDWQDPQKNNQALNVKQLNMKHGKGEEDETRKKLKYWTLTGGKILQTQRLISERLNSSLVNFNWPTD